MHDLHTSSILFKFDLFSSHVTLKIRERSPKHSVPMLNLVPIHQLVPEISCTQESVIPTQMPTVSAPKTICPRPSLSAEGTKRWWVRKNTLQLRWPSYLVKQKPLNNLGMNNMCNYLLDEDHSFCNFDQESSVEQNRLEQLSVGLWYISNKAIIHRSS